MAIIGPHVFDKMWNRLCDDFDSQSASVEAALKNLYKLKKVAPNDYRGLIKLVNEVESSYCQLEILGQLFCLTMCETTHISKLLPDSIRDEWNRLHFSLSENLKTHPFPAFMAFLDRERKIVLRLADEEHSKPIKGDSHHGSTEGKESGSDKRTKQHKKSDSNHGETGKTKPKFPDCAFHKYEKGKHKTSECEVFRKLKL